MFFFHNRCACHVLNLVVKKGLANVRPVIDKIKDLLTFIYHSNKRRHDFKKFVIAQCLKFLKPEFDIPIRWNSTYKMLRRAVRKKVVLMEFYNTVCGSENPINIDDTDWITIQQLMGILECFYNSTCRLSGVYYPTCPIALEELYLISLTFANNIGNTFWSQTILKMRSKFLKYYAEIQVLFSCAAALNPKIGVEVVEGLIECIHLNLGIGADDTKLAVEKFKSTLHAFYDHYDLLYGAKPLDIPVESGSSRDSVVQLAISRKKSKTISSSSELAKYKMTDFIGEQTDILEFWKSRACHYPVMVAMARDLLTVQASIVASESAFSFSDRVLNEKRSRLSPQSMELCIFFKDHLDASRRIQDKRDIEETSEESEEEIESHGETN